ncbi:MAG: TerB family tellurite resistance protein [Kofleriaceae bacterium]
MSLSDRIVPLCDLLLGAAYADKQFKDREREEVKGMLADLAGSLTPELATQIESFDPKKFDLAKTAAHFGADTEDERRRLLFLVAAINDADEEHDFAEDEYLRALANALILPSSALEGLIVDVEVEELKETFEKVRRGPPPPPTPKKKDDSVDVDMD